jgi:pimeloyl-ACP methyl ester carboxylesterase
MKEISFTLLALVLIYLLISAYLYLFQRKLIYYPVLPDPAFQAQPITIDNNGVKLHGWVLNPGKAKAVIYFGGNSELITHRSGYFETVFADYSVYLVDYRGYGTSEGSPGEAEFYSDALAIYDHISPDHISPNPISKDHINESKPSITAYGRSLGSGVAVYLAANRPIDQLILLTPYDSIAEVAQKIYPLFPVRWFIKDRFDSASRAADISIPVLIASAELDRVIPLEHTLALRQRFSPGRLVYQQIKGAAHNDIIDFPQYRELVESFIGAN